MIHYFVRKPNFLQNVPCIEHLFLFWLCGCMTNDPCTVERWIGAHKDTHFMLFFYIIHEYLITILCYFSILYMSTWSHLCVGTPSIRSISLIQFRLWVNSTLFAWGVWNLLIGVFMWIFNGVSSLGSFGHL